MDWGDFGGGRIVRYLLRERRLFLIKHKVDLPQPLWSYTSSRLPFFFPFPESRNKIKGQVDYTRPRSNEESTDP